MRSITALLITLLLVSCAKKTDDLVSPDPAAQPSTTTDSQRHAIDSDQTDPVFTTADTASTEAATETDEEVSATDAQEEAASPVEIKVDNVTVTPEFPKPEVALADSVFEEYMIKHGDFLSKIAKKEYGDWLMWKKIYEWNREAIGSNPNLIYPYHFLDLLKPADTAKKCPVELYDYTVSRGETLWSIAGKVFGDEIAWTILYMDNEELIDSQDGVLTPGMTIKLRKKLDPCS